MDSKVLKESGIETIAFREKMATQQGMHTVVSGSLPDAYDAQSLGGNMNCDHKVGGVAIWAANTR